MVGNGIGVYGRFFHVRDRLRLDKGRGRTTSGNCHSSAGLRAGSEPANQTTPGICGPNEFLRERKLILTSEPEPPVSAPKKSVVKRGEKSKKTGKMVD
jgi:hypothetical protein